MMMMMMMMMIMLKMVPDELCAWGEAMLDVYIHIMEDSTVAHNQRRKRAKVTVCMHGVRYVNLWAVAMGKHLGALMKSYNHDHSRCVLQ